MQPKLAPLPPDFATLWDRWYPEAPPIGFVLRDIYPERWLRIHSLPHGLRYPTSGWQQAELIRRHSAVATDVLGEGARFAFLLLRSCAGPESVGVGQRAGITAGELPDALSLSPHLWDDHSGYFGEPMGLVGAEVLWQPGDFIGFIVAVANDRVRGVLANLSTGAVYAPYDGGADLFFATEVERDLARARHAAWVPRLPGGSERR